MDKRIILETLRAWGEAFARWFRPHWDAFISPASIHIKDRKAPTKTPRTYYWLIVLALSIPGYYLFLPLGYIISAVCLILLIIRNFRTKNDLAVSTSIIFCFMLFIEALGSWSTRNQGNNQPAVVASATSEPTDTPPTSRPTPTVEDKHAKRAAYHTYWQRCVAQIAIANSTRFIATSALESNDTASAYSAIKTGIQELATAQNSALQDVPDGWDDIRDGLFLSINYLRASFESAEKFLDDRKPSDGASVQENATKATEAIDVATAAAREKYVSMGGQATDLDDVQSLTTKIEDLLKKSTQ